MSKQHLIPAKAKLHWTKLKLANKFANDLEQDQAVRIKAMQDKALAEIEANGIRLTHTESTADNLKLQGDAEMLSKENMLKRNNLKRHPRVTAVIKRFWNVLDMVKDDEGCILENPYIEMNIRLSKSLVPNDDIKEVRASAAEDWMRDVAGRDSMDYNCFFMGLFELADMWVEDIDGPEYAEFLEKLFFGVAYTDDEGDHWRAVDDIVCQIHEDDDLEDDDLELTDDLGLDDDEGNGLKSTCSFKFNSNKGWGSKKELKGDRWDRGMVGDDEANISLLGQGENINSGRDGSWRNGKGALDGGNGDALGPGEREKGKREGGWSNTGVPGTEAALSAMGGGGDDSGRHGGGWNNSKGKGNGDEYGDGCATGSGGGDRGSWRNENKALDGRHEHGHGRSSAKGGGRDSEWNGDTTIDRDVDEGSILSPTKRGADGGARSWDHSQEGVGVENQVDMNEGTRGSAGLKEGGQRMQGGGKSGLCGDFEYQSDAYDDGKGRAAGSGGGGGRLKHGDGKHGDGGGDGDSFAPVDWGDRPNTSPALHDRGGARRHTALMTPSATFEIPRKKEQGMLPSIASPGVEEEEEEEKPVVVVEEVPVVKKPPFQSPTRIHGEALPQKAATKIYMSLTKKEKEWYKKSAGLTKKMRDLYLAIGEDERDMVKHMDTQEDRLHYLSMNQEQREFFVDMRENEKDQYGELEKLMAEKKAKAEEVKALRRAEEEEKDRIKLENLKWKHTWTEPVAYMEELEADRQEMQEVCEKEFQKMAAYQSGKGGPNPLRPRTRKKIHRDGQNPEWWWGKDQRSIPPIPRKVFDLDVHLGLKKPPKPKGYKKQPWKPPITDTNHPDCVFKRRPTSMERSSKYGRYVGR
jgi:hypothetical protein